MSAMKRAWSRCADCWPFDLAHILPTDAHVNFDLSYYVCSTSSRFHLCVRCVFKGSRISFSAATCSHTVGFGKASAISIVAVCLAFCSVFFHSQRERERAMHTLSFEHANHNQHRNFPLHSMSGTHTQTYRCINMCLCPCSFNVFGFLCFEYQNKNQVQFSLSSSAVFEVPSFSFIVSLSCSPWRGVHPGLRVFAGECWGVCERGSAWMIIM